MFKPLTVLNRAFFAASSAAFRKAGFTVLVCRLMLVAMTCPAGFTVMVTTTFPTSLILHYIWGGPPPPPQKIPPKYPFLSPRPPKSPDEIFPAAPSPSVVPLLPICAPLPKAPATRLRAASSAAFRSRSAFSAASFRASSAFSAAVFSGFFASFFFFFSLRLYGNCFFLLLCQHVLLHLPPAFPGRFLPASHPLPPKKDRQPPCIGHLTHHHRHTTFLGTVRAT